MAVMYIHLDYEEFKHLEAEMKKFAETTHRTEGGFYHKSFRMAIEIKAMEFHGPLVAGYGHLKAAEPAKIEVSSELNAFIAEWWKLFKGTDLLIDSLLAIAIDMNLLFIVEIKDTLEQEIRLRKALNDIQEKQFNVGETQVWVNSTRIIHSPEEPLHRFSHQWALVRA